MATLAVFLITAPCLAQDSAAQAGTQAATQTTEVAQAAEVVQISGQAIRAVRSYRHLLPGVREFQHHHALAPAAELRFGMVSMGFPMKPLPVERASLEVEGRWFSKDWSLDVTVREDGWIVLPDSAEAEQRNAALYVSHRRNTSTASWMVDVHTPGLPAQTYRLGDLRLECRVYLVIEWVSSAGSKLMGENVEAPTRSTRLSNAKFKGDASASDFPATGSAASGLTLRDGSPQPMDGLCSGDTAVFFNTRPWPRLQAYIIHEAGRSVRHELNGHRINAKSFLLRLDRDKSAAPWSDNALVEFVFYDNSHWTTATPVPAPKNTQ